MDAISTEFTKQFGIRFPIVSAPMFLVSNVEMVVATGEAGGIGTFPALNFRPIENFKKAIADIKSKTKAPFGINIIVQKSNRHQHDQLDIALDEKVPWLITSLGNPKEIIKRAHEVGTKVYCDVIGLEHAKKVKDYGADGLIAVGAGAGGHAGTVSNFALIPLLCSETQLPVLAAGSIVDGKGMAAAFALGAAGIYMGTRFIASKEGGASKEYKKAIVDASCEDIISTHRVDGFPGNFILNDSLRKLGLEDSVMEQIASRSKKIKKWISLGRAARTLLGSPEGKASYKTVYSAGHGVGLIDSIPTIKEIIENTVQEYQALKGELP